MAKKKPSGYKQINYDSNLLNQAIKDVQLSDVKKKEWVDYNELAPLGLAKEELMQIDNERISNGFMPIANNPFRTAEQPKKEVAAAKPQPKHFIEQNKDYIQKARQDSTAFQAQSVTPEVVQKQLQNYSNAPKEYFQNMPQINITDKYTPTPQDKAIIDTYNKQYGENAKYIKDVVTGLERRKLNPDAFNADVNQVNRDVNNVYRLLSNDGKGNVNPTEAYKYYAQAVDNSQKTEDPNDIKKFKIENTTEAERAKNIQSAYNTAWVNPIGTFAEGYESGVAGMVKGGLGLIELTGIADTEQARNNITQWETELAKNTPNDKLSNWVRNIGSGVASQQTFFLPGMGVSKLANVIGNVSPKIANWFGAGTMGMLEAGVEAGSDYNDIIERTGDSELATRQAWKTFGANIVMNSILDKVAYFKDGKAPDGLLKRSAKGFGAESLQETLQQLISNYNTSKPIDEGLIESFVIGGLIGAGSTFNMQNDAEVEEFIKKKDAVVNEVVNEIKKQKAKDEDVITENKVNNAVESNTIPETNIANNENAKDEVPESEKPKVNAPEVSIDAYNKLVEESKSPDITEKIETVKADIENKPKDDKLYILNNKGVRVPLPKLAKTYEFTKDETPYFIVHGKTHKLYNKNTGELLGEGATRQEAIKKLDTVNATPENVVNEVLPETNIESPVPQNIVPEIANEVIPQNTVNNIQQTVEPQTEVIEPAQEMPQVNNEIIPQTLPEAEPVVETVNEVDFTKLDKVKDLLQAKSNNLTQADVDLIHNSLSKGQTKPLANYGFSPKEAKVVLDKFNEVPDIKTTLEPVIAQILKDNPKISNRQLAEQLKSVEGYSPQKHYGITKELKSKYEVKEPVPTDEEIKAKEEQDRLDAIKEQEEIEKVEEQKRNTLATVQKNYGDYNKYNDIVLTDNKSLSLRIADHSGRAKNTDKDTGDFHLSIVIGDNPTKQKFYNPDDAMPNEYYFEGTETPEEIISFIDSKVDEFKKIAEEAEAKELSPISGKEGKESKVILANKERLDAKFMVVESDDIIQSHDPENFWDNEKFPKEGELNANDRNYKDDIENQKHVIQRSTELMPELLITNAPSSDGGTPIVGKDGVVVSGNGRVMMLKRAIKRNTKGYNSYKDMLLNEAEAYGINPEDIKGLKNPVLVRVLIEPIEYTRQNLRKFNQTSNKSVARKDELVTLSTFAKTVSNTKEMKNIFDELEEHETLALFFSKMSKKAKKDIYDTLIKSGVILDNETSAYFDGADYNLTERGKELFINFMLGMSFSPEMVKVLSQEHMRAFRDNTVIKLLPLFVTNTQLGDYSISEELNGAIRIISELKLNSYYKGDLYNLLADVGLIENNDLADENTVLIAELFNEYSYRKVKEAIQTYTESSVSEKNQIKDIEEGSGLDFGVDPRTKEDIFTETITNRIKTYDEDKGRFSKIKEIVEAIRSDAGLEQSKETVRTGAEKKTSTPDETTKQELTEPTEPKPEAKEVKETIPEKEEVKSKDSIELSFKQLNEFNARAKRSDITKEELVNQFKLLTENEDEVKKIILEWVETKESYKRKRADTKKKYAEEVYNHFLEVLALSGEGVFSFSPMQESVRQAQQRIINATTDEMLIKQKEEKEKRLSHLKKSLENPETLEEFRTKAMHKELTKEEKSKLEDLQAGNKKELIANGKTKEKERALEALNFDEFTIEESKHTKTDKPIWIMKPKERLETSVYKETLEKVKKLGGYYSTYVRGFVFNNNPTEITEKDNTPKLIKLKDLGNQTIEKADETLNQERLENTARRASIADNIRDAARREKQIGQTMVNIAEAQEQGKVKLLDKVSTKADVKQLEDILHKAHYDNGRKNNVPDYRNAPYKIEDVQEAEYPKFVYYKDWGVDSLIKDIGSVRLQQQIIKEINNSKEQLVDLTKYLSRLLEDKKFMQSTWLKDSAIKADQDIKRLKKLGIDSVEDLRAHLREYYTLREGYVGKTEQELLKEKERDITRTNIPGFFPTPTDIVSQMIDYADIEKGMSILEPSAGKGNIADAIKEEFPDNPLEVVEYNSSLYELLKDKGYDAKNEDFLETSGSYDRIVMNPPFEKGADIDHVLHAYDMLNDNGRLVSVMSSGAFSRSDSKAKEFQKWLKDVDAEVIDLEEGSFKSSERPTGVSTKLVIVNKNGYGKDLRETNYAEDLLNPEIKDKVFNALKATFPQASIVTGSNATEFLNRDGVKRLASYKRNTNGEIEIYLSDEALKRLDAPLHEFGHLFLDILHENAKDLYQQGISLVKNNAVELQQAIKKSYPELNPDSNEFYEEALAHLIGQGLRVNKVTNNKNRSKIKEFVDRVWLRLNRLLSKAFPFIRPNTRLNEMSLDSFIAHSIDVMLSGMPLTSPDAIREALQTMKNDIETSSINNLLEALGGKVSDYKPLVDSLAMDIDFEKEVLQGEGTIDAKERERLKELWNVYQTVPVYFKEKYPHFYNIWNIIDRRFSRDINRDKAVLTADYWNYGHDLVSMPKDSQLAVTTAFKDYFDWAFKQKQLGLPVEITWDDFIKLYVKDSQAETFIRDAYIPFIQKSISMLGEMETALIRDVNNEEYPEFDRVKGRILKSVSIYNKIAEKTETKDATKVVKKRKPKLKEGAVEETKIKLTPKQRKLKEIKEKIDKRIEKIKELDKDFDSYTGEFTPEEVAEIERLSNDDIELMAELERLYSINAKFRDNVNFRENIGRGFAEKKYQRQKDTVYFPTPRNAGEYSVRATIPKEKIIAKYDINAKDNPLLEEFMWYVDKNSGTDEDIMNQLLDNAYSELNKIDPDIYLGMTDVLGEEPTIEERVNYLQDTWNDNKDLRQAIVDKKVKIAKDKTVYFNSFYLKEDADKQAEGLSKEGYDVKIDLFDDTNDKLIQNDVSQLDLLELAELSNVSKSNNGITQMLKHIKGKKFTRHFIRKGFIPGYEFNIDNMMKSIDRYINTLSAFKNKTIGQIELDNEIAKLKEEGYLKENTLEKNYLDRVLSYLNTYSKSYGKALSGILSVWKLALKMGYYFQQLMQPFKTLLAEIPFISRETNVPKSKLYKYGTLDMPKLLLHWYGLKFENLKNRAKGKKRVYTTPKLDPEFTKLAIELEDAGTLAPIKMREMFGYDVDNGRASDEVFTSDTARKAKKLLKKTKVDVIGKYIYKGIALPGLAVEDATRMVGFNVFYNAAKSAGLKGEELKSYISDKMSQTYGASSGKLSRPPGYHISSDSPNGEMNKISNTLIESITKFKPFTFMNQGQWGKILRAATTKDKTKRLYSPLLLKSLATMSFTGVMGYTFMLSSTWLMQLLLSLFNFEPEKPLEEVIEDAVKEVPVLGGVLEKGLFSSITPWDVSDLMNESTALITEGAKYSKNPLTLMGGAYVGFGWDLYEAYKQKNVMKAMPSVVKNISRANDWSEKGLTYGNKILEKPENIKALDYWSQLLGMPTNFANEKYDEYNSKEYSKKVIYEDLESEKDNILKMIKNKNHNSLKNLFNKYYQKAKSNNAVGEKVKDLNDYIKNATSSVRDIELNAEDIKGLNSYYRYNLNQNEKKTLASVISLWRKGIYKDEDKEDRQSKPKKKVKPPKFQY